MNLSQATNTIITYEAPITATATATTMTLLLDFWMTFSTVQLMRERIPFNLFVSFLDQGTVPNGDYRECQEGPYYDRASRQDRVDRVKAVVVGKEATGETIDRERVAEAVYPSIWYWMGFFIDAVVIPHPGATKAGDDDGGVVASTGAVIFPVVERHGGNDDQEDGN